MPLADQFVTAFTIAEIERGIVTKERSDATQGRLLRVWLEDRVLPAFAGRVLAFDLGAARVLASYRIPDHAPLDDAYIASVAAARGMTIVTRNVRHFARLGVPWLDPWAPATR